MNFSVNMIDVKRIIVSFEYLLLNLIILACRFDQDSLITGIVLHIWYYNTIPIILHVFLSIFWFVIVLMLLSWEIIRYDKISWIILSLFHIKTYNGIGSLYKSENRALISLVEHYFSLPIFSVRSYRINDPRNMYFLGFYISGIPKYINELFCLVTPFHEVQIKLKQLQNNAKQLISNYTRNQLCKDSCGIVLDYVQNEDLSFLAKEPLFTRMTINEYYDVLGDIPAEISLSRMQNEACDRIDLNILEYAGIIRTDDVLKPNLYL